MNPTDLAQSIHDRSLQLADIDASIAAFRLQAEAAEHTANMEIAFRSDLKNDPQRKAMHAELLIQNEGYAIIQDELTRLTREKAIALADLELVRNQLKIVMGCQVPAPITPQEPTTTLHRIDLPYLLLTLSPESRYEWDRIMLHDPVTMGSPDLLTLISQAAEGVPGKYLIKARLDVEVLLSKPTGTLNSAEVASDV